MVFPTISVIFAFSWAWCKQKIANFAPTRSYKVLLTSGCKSNVSKMYLSFPTCPQCTHDLSRTHIRIFRSTSNLVCSISTMAASHFERFSRHPVVAQIQATSETQNRSFFASNSVAYRVQLHTGYISVWTKTLKAAWYIFTCWTWWKSNPCSLIFLCSSYGTGRARCPSNRVHPFGDRLQVHACVLDNIGIKMAWREVFGLLAAVAVFGSAVAGKRTLILVDNWSIRESHSIFFKNLRGMYLDYYTCVGRSVS